MESKNAEIAVLATAIAILLAKSVKPGELELLGALLNAIADQLEILALDLDHTKKTNESSEE